MAKEKRGWADGAVVKYSPYKLEDPSSDSQNPKEPGTVVQRWKEGVETGGSLEACWPVSLAYLVKFQTSERPCCLKQRSRGCLRNSPPCCLLNLTCVHTHEIPLPTKIEKSDNI